MAIKDNFIAVGECIEISNRKKDAQGYYSLGINSGYTKYHRHLWEKANGPIAKSEILRHTCGNPSCLNLSHMKKGLNSQDIEYIIDEKGCHVCTSHKPCQYGYPQGRDKVNSTGVTEYLHRIVWKRNFGPIEKGLVVRHRCDNRMCVNPGHLELGTNKDNTQDMVDRGRQAKGSSIGMAKINEDIARKMKEMRADGMLFREIGEVFGVRWAIAQRVCNGLTWKHVD